MSVGSDGARWDSLDGLVDSVGPEFGFFGAGHGIAPMHPVFRFMFWGYVYVCIV